MATLEFGKIYVIMKCINQLGRTLLHIPGNCLFTAVLNLHEVGLEFQAFLGR